MAKAPFSLLILRRVSRTQNPSLSPLHHHRSHVFSIKPYSTSQPTSPVSISPYARTSLSARMSFVFDQIDAIEKERFHKDEALQRIRAWRESKNNYIIPRVEHHPVPQPEIIDNAVDVQREGLMTKQEVELVHPWKEWIELMDRLIKLKYFDHQRTNKDKDENEDGMVEDSRLDMSAVAQEEVDFTRDYKTVQLALEKFAADRFDIVRSFSRKDIQLLVGYGCPSLERKVIAASKLLRKLARVDEGDVCCSCSLRNSCERAFLLKDDEYVAKTRDVMRVLLAFAFDSVNGSVDNKPLLKLKSVKTVVRKLLHQVVRLSAVPIHPNLSPPIIKERPPKVKLLHPPRKKRYDGGEMKNGDWLCPECNFMNYAKNTECLECDAKRPKRQLLPGEWECYGCKFLNYRRNMACLECQRKRPPDEYTEKLQQEIEHLQHVPNRKMRLERVANRREVSNAWNFDFDDAESDGADVAAFEHADSPKMDEEVTRGNFREPEDNFDLGSRSPRSQERDCPNPDHNKPRLGFDDFDDFDDEDDVDSYETVSQNSTLLEVRGHSEFEDNGPDGDLHGHSRQSQQMHQEAALSGAGDDFHVDSDEDLPIQSNWISSHVSDFGETGRGRRAGGPPGDVNFGSDKELEHASGCDSDLGDGVPISQGKGFGSARQAQFRSDDEMGNRINFFNDNFDGSHQGSYGNDGGRKGDSYGGGRFDNDMERNYGHDRRQRHAFDRGTDRGYRGNNHGGRGFDSMDRDYGRERPRFDRGSGGGDWGNNHGGQGFNDMDYGRERPRFDQGSGGGDWGNNHGGRGFDGMDRDYGWGRPRFDRGTDRGYRGNDHSGRGFNSMDRDYDSERPQFGWGSGGGDWGHNHGGRGFDGMDGDYGRERPRMLNNHGGQGFDGMNRDYGRERPRVHGFVRSTDRGYRDNNHGGRGFSGMDEDEDYARDRHRRR